MTKKTETTKKVDAPKEETPRVATTPQEQKLIDADARIKELDAQLASKEVKKAVDVSDIEVEDPQVLRPKELPLVVKPKGGKWKNEEQEEYARTLNGYAYKNPIKWAKKKDALIKKLAEIGENPEVIIEVRGNVTSVNYKNQLMAD